MDYIYQLIENIRIRATTIANQQYIPDNILRTETESAGNNILELAEKLRNEIEDVLKNK